MPPSTLKTDGKSLPILILAAVLLIGIVIFVSTQFGGGRVSKLEPFPAVSYMDKPTDYLGNTYAMRAQIDTQLHWDRELGRVLAVRPEGQRDRLPVFVPSEVGANLHTGQRYEMQVRIDEGGLIYVEDLRKY
ncbi:MAG: hypothetical protein AAGC73_00880 [Verrucomicrobiota bacterium]